MLQICAVLALVIGVLFITASQTFILLPISFVVLVIYYSFFGRSDSLRTQFSNTRESVTSKMLRPASPSMRRRSTPLHRNMGASSSLKKSNNENKFFPGSPNLSAIHTPSPGTGIFGHTPSGFNQTLSNSYVSNKNPAFLQHLGSNKQVLMEAQNISGTEAANTTPVFANSLPVQEKSYNSLPTVRRHQDR